MFCTHPVFNAAHRAPAWFPKGEMCTVLGAITEWLNDQMLISVDLLIRRQYILRG